MIDDDALVWRRVRVPVRDVVHVRAVLDASEGLANMFAERGGDLLLVAPTSQRDRLDELIGDFALELGAIVTDRSDTTALCDGGTAEWEMNRLNGGA